jgi:prepilin-type N-terminal cleavage/methylation domain-containing protein
MSLSMRIKTNLKTRKWIWASPSKGFTLIELALVVVVIAVVAAYAVPRLGAMNETAEVTVARTAQAQMEQTIAQAAMRMDLSPTQIMNNNQPLPNPIRTTTGQMITQTRDAVVELVQRSLSNEPNTAARVINLTCANANFCRIEFPRTQRMVEYTVNPNGSLTIANIRGPWQQYRLVNGQLSKI